MPYADRTKRNEYDKLYKRRMRGSKLDVSDKTPLEQMAVKG